MERPPTPEQDFELARRALEKGELRHAAEHLAGALAADPTRPQFLSLADELLARGPENAAQLLGLNEQGANWFGAVALRAYLLARTGGGTDAVSLLLRASSAGAQAKYLAWLRGWLEQPGFVEALDPERVAGALEGFFESVPQALQESMLEPV
ncbi:MAG TPA: hypothetical protein VK420_21810, partial [Longimicrobium sp.]|nr:hypothetical protein [Longimicrobium sp.]